MPWSSYAGEKTTWLTCFSPSTGWLQRTELRLSGLVPSPPSHPSGPGCSRVQRKVICEPGKEDCLLQVVIERCNKKMGGTWRKFGWAKNFYISLEFKLKIWILLELPKM